MTPNNSLIKNIQNLRYYLDYLPCPWRKCPFFWNLNASPAELLQFDNWPSSRSDHSTNHVFLYFHVYHVFRKKNRKKYMVKKFNNRFLRERGMAFTPKMEYQVLLCVFQKYSAMATLGLKEMKKWGVYSGLKVGSAADTAAAARAGHRSTLPLRPWRNSFPWGGSEKGLPCWLP